MKRIALLTIAAFVWPFAANADIDYNYVQGDLIVDGEFDGGIIAPDDDYDGWSLEGSVAITPMIFLRGEYTDLSFDDNGDADALSLGGGMQTSLGSTEGATDIYGILSYENADLGDGADADGYGLTAGLRWVPTTGIEINPSVAYIDYGEIDGTDLDFDGWRLGLRGLFNLTDQIALNVEWNKYEQEVSTSGVSADFGLDNEILLGARLYWQ